MYCGTSREGSLLRFYLRHVAKYPNVRLYEGSWKEYVSLKQHAVETAIFIAEKIKDKDPAAAKTAAEKVLKIEPTGKLADRARALTKAP